MIGKKVQVYRNLNNGMLSIKCATTKRVIGYAHSVILRDCSATVQQGGRARVLREKQKSVHAWITGTLEAVDTTIIFNNLEGQAISYNPYKADHFYNIDTLQPWTQGKRVFMENVGGKYVTTIAQ